MEQNNEVDNVSSTHRVEGQRLISKYFIYTVGVICLGSLQFGYHIAELNAPQQYLSCSEFSDNWDEVPYTDTWLGRHNLEQCIPLDNTQLGTVISMFSVGGLIGSSVARTLSSTYGRKKSLVFGNIFNFISSWLLFNSNSYSSLIVGRLLSGVGSGIIIVNVPLYISEITPVDLRGLMGSMNQVSINCGIIVTQFIALFFANSYEWRWILFAGLVIAVLNIFLIVKIDESPTWLVLNNNVIGAEIALFKLRQNKDIVTRDIQEIHNELSSDQTGSSSDLLDEPSKGAPSFWQYFISGKYSKPRMVITMLLMGQQFLGINSIIFYGVKIVGNIAPSWAISINFGISVLNVVMTIVSSFIVDKKGRKPLLLFSVIMMGVTSLLISVSITHKLVMLLIVSLLAYIASFAMGVGPIPFLIISELSHSNDAITAQSYGTVCNWIAVFIIAFCFPVLHDLFGGYVFILFSLFAVYFTVYIYKKVPETKKRRTYNQLWANY